MAFAPMPRHQTLNGAHHLAIGATLKAACNAEAKTRLKERARRRNGYYSNDDWNPRLVARFAQALERQHRRTTP